MKIKLNHSEGSVLLGTIFFTGIICLYLGGYLSLVRSENAITTRSQTWNMAIPAAEAGIEEAMTHLTTSFPSYPATKGWLSNGDFLVKSNQLDPNNYYIVAILTSPLGCPKIFSEGFSRPPSKTNFISRTVQVKTKAKSIAAPGLIVVETASLNGSTIYLDSFDSTTNTASTNGKYDPAKRRANGLLGTLSGVGSSIDLGNSKVWGKIASAPNLVAGQDPILRPNAAVGDLNFMTLNSKGIQAGHYTRDVDITVEQVKAPFTSAPTLQKATTNGFDYEISSNGEYKHVAGPGNNIGKLLVRGNATLLVDGSFSLSKLEIAPGASLKLYANSPTVDITGTYVNTSGTAASFQLFGLPTCTTIAAGGNAEFTAMIYAPNAALTMKGGGSGVSDFSGTSLSKTLSLGGGYRYHYDESCTNEMRTGYIVISWDEITPTVSSLLATPSMAKL